MNNKAAEPLPIEEQLDRLAKRRDSYMKLGRKELVRALDEAILNISVKIAAQNGGVEKKTSFGNDSTNAEKQRESAEQTVESSSEQYEQSASSQSTTEAILVGPDSGIDLPVSDSAIDSIKGTKPSVKARRKVDRIIEDLSAYQTMTELVIPESFGKAEKWHFVTPNDFLLFKKQKDALYDSLRGALRYPNSATDSRFIEIERRTAAIVAYVNRYGREDYKELILTRKRRLGKTHFYNFEFKKTVDNFGLTV